jgi:hypothetical protein
VELTLFDQNFAPRNRHLMHSHDRTLVARLGFDDQDKKDHRHSLACTYLASEYAAPKLFELCFAKPHEWENVRCDDLRPYNVHIRGIDTVVQAGVETTKYEWPISKGEGQYRTTIGFIDLRLTFRCQISRRSASRRPTNGHSPYSAPSRTHNDQWGEWNALPDESLSEKRTLCVEVKIGQVGADEILRQIGLYRQYLDDPQVRFVAATLFDIEQYELEQLSNANIMWVKLASGFEEYVNTYGKVRADTAGREL